MSIDLNPIDELIKARSELAGDSPGRPPLENGETLGLAVQKATIVMLSAALQSFVEDVFFKASRKALKPLKKKGIEKYKKSYNRGGNPNTQNINDLFLRLGIENVLDGLSWQGCSNKTVRNKLDHLNQLRNGVAHGHRVLKIDNQETKLQQKTVMNYRNFVEQFGDRFKDHVWKTLR